MHTGAGGRGDLRLVKIGHRGQLVYRRRATVLLQKLLDGLVHFTEDSHLVEGHSHNPALHRQSLHDALANPPNGVRDELEASCLIEFLGGLDQTHITLVDQVGERDALMLILLGHRNHETQIATHQPVASTLALSATLMDGLCQRCLLVGREHGFSRDLREIAVKGLAVATGNVFRDFKLSHFVQVI